MRSDLNRRGTGKGILACAPKEDLTLRENKDRAYAPAKPSIGIGGLAEHERKVGLELVPHPNGSH